MKNATVTFQRAMNVILTTINRQYALVYIDDVMIFLKASKEHLRRIKEELNLLNRARITIKLKKCAFTFYTIDYMGHVIVPGKLHVANRITKAVKALQYPTTATKLQ